MAPEPPPNRITSVTRPIADIPALRLPARQELAERAATQAALDANP